MLLGSHGGVGRRGQVVVPPVVMHPHVAWRGTLVVVGLRLARLRAAAEEAAAAAWAAELGPCHPR